MSARAPKISKYTGVCRSGTKYKAQVDVSRQQFHLGCYHLESDAGWAYDKALGIINDGRKSNFKSEKKYKEARDIEIKERDLAERGIDIDDTTKIQIIIRENLKALAGNISKIQVKRTHSSKYTGVNKNPKETKYEVKVRGNGQVLFLGYYLLESDAAWAWDQKKGKSTRRKIFDSEKEYLEARQQEMKERGIDDADLKIA
eukprot:scaffold331945_cov63-Cyclotella_meneghiniana.AAC.1